MGWVYLVFAGLMEIGWPVGFKLAQAETGFRWPPALFGVASMLASFGLMLLAQKTIPIGTSEVTVLDQKKLEDQQVWVQVRDPAQRVGWVKRDQIALL